LAAAGLAALLTAFLLSLPATFFDGFDYVAMHGFNREYLRRAVTLGEFPWWNPYTALGRPFFADIETATAYPPTWLIFPLGVTLGVTACVLLHFWIALWGFRLLAGALGAATAIAWLGAITFACSGPVLARLQIGQITVFSALCWLPLMFYVGMRVQDTPGRRTIAALAGVECAAILAGSPNVVWLGNSGLVVFLVARNSSPVGLLTLGLSLTAGLLLAGCLAAFQLLSFAELIAEGNRPLLGTNYASMFGVHPTTWLSLVAPLGGPFRFAPEFNFFVGAPLALFGLAAVVAGWSDRNLRALIFLAVFGLVLSAGHHLPVLGWLADWLPGFGSMRYPSRYAVLTVFAVVLAGSVFLGRHMSSRSRLGFGILITLQCGSLIASAIQLTRHYRTVSTGYWDSALREDLTDNGYFSGVHFPPRIAFEPSRVRSNSGMVEGYSTLDGFANPMLRNVWDAAHREARVAPPSFELHQMNPEIYRSGPFPMVSASLVAGWDANRSATIFRSVSDASPRAWLTPRAQTAPERKLNPTADSVTLTRFSRNVVALRASATVPVLLSVAEANYPGWQVRVNSHKSEMLINNGWMRGVNLPTGTSLVHFEFRPRFLTLGSTISVIAGIAFLFLWLRAR